jgi:nucleoid DNA-binding protein
MPKDVKALHSANRHVVSATAQKAKEEEEMVRKVSNHLFYYIHTALLDGADVVQVPYFGKFQRKLVSNKQLDHAKLI